MLRVLEGHGDERHVGPQLHVAHRRQAVQGMLRKSPILIIIKKILNSVHISSCSARNTIFVYLIISRDAPPSGPYLGHSTNLLRCVRKERKQ